SQRPHDGPTQTLGRGLVDRGGEPLGSIVHRRERISHCESPRRPDFPVSGTGILGAWRPGPAVSIVSAQDESVCAAGGGTDDPARPCSQRRRRAWIAAVRIPTRWYKHIQAYRRKGRYSLA